MMVCSSTLFITLALSVAASSSLAFSSITPRGLSLSSLSSAVVEEEQHVDRPLLRQFGDRIVNVSLILNMDIIGKIIVLLLMGMMHIRLRRLYPV